MGMLAALICLVLLITGCGGGGSSSSTTNEEASLAFIKKGHVNVLPKFGEEASEEEREAVNAIVVENLEARASGDFATQCETLGKKGLAEIPEAKSQKACAKALKKFAEPLSETKKAREDTLKGSIAALRVKGDKGWALYHGDNGKDYAVPLEKEGRTWKVGSVLTTEL